MKNKLYQYLLLLADNAMILGHRLSELCGHGPSLETDIALTNISLDFFGQVRNYFQYAAQIVNATKDAQGKATIENATEDSIAFLRPEQEYRNVCLVEQANTDFAFVIGRQFLYDAYHLPLLEQLLKSKDETIAAIAAKSIKECRYHVRFSSSWLKRLGDGTSESHQKMQAAINYLYPYAAELFQETELEKEMKDLGIGADLTLVKEAFDAHVKEVLGVAGLKLPTVPAKQLKGKQGVHTEYMGHILAELQFMQRAYPNMQW